MDIKNITVGGFRNLENTRIKFNGLVAVVSPNNYGKSNLLEAIDFATDFLTASSKQRRKMMGWKNGIPLIKKMENHDFIFEIEIYEPNNKEYSHIKYGFSFKWYRDDKSGQRITNEWLELHGDDTNRYSSYLKRDENKYRKGNSTTAYRKLTLDESQLAIDILASVTDLDYASVIQTIKKFKYRICTSIDVQNRFQSPPIEAFDNDETEIKFDDEDIPRALYSLKTNYPEKYNIFKEAVVDLFPEFDDIDVQSYTLKNDEHQLKIILSEIGEEKSQEIPFRIRNEIYRIIVKSSVLNQPIDISLMSAGTKRVIWILTNVFVASCTNVSCVGIEELESSIHPRLLKRLLEVLNEAMENTKIIITSHSPYLIQYIKPENIFLGAPSNEGVAQFSTLQNNKIKLVQTTSREMGLSVGEYLFELYSGDGSSIRLLSSYLTRF